MPGKGDLVEKCCRAYWDSYRAGFLAVGGDKSYPAWDEFTETRAKDETRRCMRHALEVLKGIIPDFDTHFSGKPMRRKAKGKLQAEVQADALNKGQ